MSQVPAGMSKVFILDKYFSELQKFWDTEKRLKGKPRKFLTSVRVSSEARIDKFSRAELTNSNF